MPGDMQPKKMNKRPDHDGTHRAQFERNKKIIYATQSICGICGKPVDKTLNWRNPMSKSVDHIIPISKGGHPSDMDNLQLTHRACNIEKSDKLSGGSMQAKQEVTSMRILPQLHDWKVF